MSLPQGSARITFPSVVYRRWSWSGGTPVRRADVKYERSGISYWRTGDGLAAAAAATAAGARGP